jgi:hypothetical protein
VSDDLVSDVVDRLRELQKDEPRCVMCFPPAEPPSVGDVTMTVDYCQRHLAGAKALLGEALIRRYCPCNGVCHKGQKPCSIDCCSHHAEVTRG